MLKDLNSLQHYLLGQSDIPITDKILNDTEKYWEYYPRSWWYWLFLLTISKCTTTFQNLCILQMSAVGVTWRVIIHLQYNW